MHAFHHIKEDLQKVQLLIQKNFMIRAGRVNELVKQDFNFFDTNLRPAMVLICHRLFGPVNHQAIALASVLQFIFMASRVHIGLKEGAAGKEKPAEIRTGYQFPVLVGDYLYGKFFTTLCDAGIVRYLEHLGELICIINKNGITGLRNPDSQFTDTNQYVNIVRGESAELFALSASLGADLAGADAVSKRRLYEFGLNFGMAYGLLERGASQKQVSGYLTLAESIIEQSSPGTDTKSLGDLLDLLSKDNSVVQRMVV